MEQIQQLFDEKKYSELIKQTADSGDYNVLFLRARAFIAQGEFDAGLNAFKQAVTNCGVWLDCLDPFSDFQKEMGKRIASDTREHLALLYNELGARRPEDNKVGHFDHAAGLINTYNKILNGMRDVMETICPMPSIIPAMGLPEKSRAVTSFIEDWVKSVEKMFNRCLTRWSEDAEGILAEPDYRDATFGDIVIGRIACSNVVLMLGWLQKEDYAKNIAQCDRVIRQIIRVVSTEVHTKNGSTPLIQGEIRQKLVRECQDAIAWRKSVDASYIPPQIPPQPQARPNYTPEPQSTASSGGCYVATAVYGSYDCPQVWTLRRYRDYTLAKTWYGRAFIKTYYAISPTLVKWFGHTDWFKKMWQDKLDRMVAKLNAEGVDNTPYIDLIW